MKILYTNQPYYSDKYQRNCNNSSAIQPAFKGQRIDRFREFTTTLIKGRLDRKSPACEFFGSGSFKSVKDKIGNHLSLIWYKYTQEGVIISLAKTVLDIDNPAWGKILKKSLIKNNDIKDLIDNRAAIMHFRSHSWGTRKQQGTHTIGLVINPEDKKLYVLDSLPKELKIVNNYQKQLHNIFTEELAKTNSQGEKPYEIIFSSKLQELYTNGYTCDNWAIANIDAVKNALKKGTKITNQKELNNVLPNDINKILKEQQLFVNTYKPE